MNKIVVVVLAIAVVLLGGYFLLKAAYHKVPIVPQSPSQQSAPQLPAKENTVTYTDSGYSPSTLQIKKGETVTFKNESLQSMWPASAVHPTHRLYSGTSLSEHCPDTAGTAFDACKGFLPGSSWPFKFDKAGTWNYHNHLNPGDRGMIVVE